MPIDAALAATDGVCAPFEVCDTRMRDWKCPYPDFSADNGFSARIVLSGRLIRVGDVDLLGEAVTLAQDGTAIAVGKREMALGHPANALAWLAARLAEHGRSIPAGALVMPGTLTPVTPIAAGSTYLGSFAPLGSAEKTFT